MSRSHADIEALVAAEYPRLVRTARVIVGDSAVAEGITQEALARLVERWGRLRSYDDPAAWLRLVVVRLARRHRGRPMPVAIDTQPIASAGASSEAERAAVRVSVARALTDLPRAQREAVALFYLHDLTTEQVAETLGRAPGTVRAQLHQARQQLGRSLGELDDCGSPKVGAAALDCSGLGVQAQGGASRPGASAGEGREEPQRENSDAG